MATYPDIIEDPYEYQSLLGFEMVEWTETLVRIQAEMKPKLTNRYGLPHGGVHASLLDTAMGYCGCFTGDPDNKKFAMTLSMTVNYLSRPKGKMLIAEGVKIGGGRKVFFAEGKVFDETGELIATGSGSFRYRTGSAG